MTHICPKCDGANVRRSSTPVAELTWRNNFCSRYRCRDCLHEFWAIRRKTRASAIMLVVAIELAIVAVVVIESMLNNS
jgi:hypothetical protein